MEAGEEMSGIYLNSWGSGLNLSKSHYDNF